MKNPPKLRPPNLRVVRPEDEDRRTDDPAVSTGEVKGPPLKPKPTASDPRAKEDRVESMPDGEAAAEAEAAKARDD